MLQQPPLHKSLLSKDPIPGYTMLFEEHRPQLYNVALRMLGQGEDARDAVQEVWLKAAMHLHELKHADALGSWLNSIMRNHCLMELRYRRKKAVTEQGYYQLQDALTDAMHISDRCPYQIRETIAGLSEPLQLAAMLRFYGWRNSYDDIAKVLGISTGTVKSRLAEARNQLAAALQPQYEKRTNGKAKEMEQFFSYVFEGIYKSEACRAMMYNNIEKDLQIVFSSGKTAHGGHLVAQEVEYDLYHGSRAVLQEVHSSGNISVLEFHNITSAEYPDACPPASTFIMVHPYSKTQKLYMHHCERTSERLY